MSDNIISKKKKNKKKVNKSSEKPMEVLNEGLIEDSVKDTNEDSANPKKEHRIRKAIADKIRRSYEFPLWKWLIILLVVSLFEGVLLEMLGRRSLLSPFVFIIHNPLVIQAFVYHLIWPPSDMRSVQNNQMKINIF